MISEGIVREFTVKIKEARSRILQQYPFFGVLMMNMRFALDDTVGTAATDGTRIFFDPAFELGNDELDFVIMHELMHVALDHLARGKKYNRMIFNIAADIVVNSNLTYMMGLKCIKIDGEEPMHIAPDGKEGRLYSAEQVYFQLLKEPPDEKNNECFDNHTLWDEITSARRQEIRSVVNNAIAALDKNCGALPAGLERELNEIGKPRLDWRNILAQFIQEDMLDYSFTSPDRRFSDIIMPSLIYTDGSVKNILFMVDTSGSMEEEDITACFSEIIGAIEQFDGKLSGLLGFFDAKVTPPIPFESVNDINKIRPVGGGGTSVDVVFDYIKENMTDEPPASIIILTDGWVDFPETDEYANGIPVMWVLTNDYCWEKPEWGTTVVIDHDENDEDD